MNKLLIALGILTLISCKNSEKNAPSETAAAEIEKTKESKVTKKDKKKIKFSIRVINPYCGGAAPSDEMEIARMKGEPAKEFIFYLNNESEDPIRMITDMEGSASIELNNGKYCVKEGYKSDPEMIKKLNDSDWEFDNECLADWKNQCNQEFVVSDSSSNLVKFTYYPRCGWEGPVPCITNAGFPPP